MPFNDWFSRDNRYNCRGTPVSNDNCEDTRHSYEIKYDSFNQSCVPYHGDALGPTYNENLYDKFCIRTESHRNGIFGVLSIAFSWQS